jgi:hypothetical protein
MLRPFFLLKYTICPAGGGSGWAYGAGHSLGWPRLLLNINTRRNDMSNEQTPLEKEIAYLVKATGNLVTVITLWFLITQVYAGLDFIMHSLFGV